MVFKSMYIINSKKLKQNVYTFSSNLKPSLPKWAFYNLKIPQNEDMNCSYDLISVVRKLFLLTFLSHLKEKLNSLTLNMLQTKCEQSFI